MKSLLGYHISAYHPAYSICSIRMCMSVCMSICPPVSQMWHENEPAKETLYCQELTARINKKPAFCETFLFLEIFYAFLYTFVYLRIHLFVISLGLFAYYLLICLFLHLLYFRGLENPAHFQIPNHLSSLSGFLWLFK